MLYLLRSEVGLQILMFTATGLQIQSNREEEFLRNKNSSSRSNHPTMTSPNQRLLLTVS